MNQVIGVNDWYLFPQVARIIALQRIAGPVILGITPDDAACAAAAPDLERCVRELRRLLGDQLFMAGDRLSIVDLILAPQLFYLSITPKRPLRLARMDGSAYSFHDFKQIAMGVTVASRSPML